MDCTWCERLLTDGQAFCGWCGRAQSTDIAAAKAYVDEQLTKRLDTEISHRFRDKEVATAQITQQVVERLVTWGKWFVGALSILLTLLAIILLRLGYDQWSKVATSAEHELIAFTNKLEKEEK